MNNEELKKKIVDIIQMKLQECPFQPIGITYGEAAEYVADALIAAWIGDVSELKNHRIVAEYSLIPEGGNGYVLPSIPLRIKQLYSGEEVEQVVKERSEYKHRAEVAERALRNAATRLKCRGGLGKGFCRVDKCNYYHCNNDNGCIKAHLEQAEKELAEEKNANKT